MYWTGFLECYIHIIIIIQSRLKPFLYTIIPAIICQGYAIAIPQKLVVKRCSMLSAYFLLSAQFCASFTALCQAHMPSKPAGQRAIGYMSLERRLEVGLRRKFRELRSLVASQPPLQAFLPRHVLYARPTYRVLAFLIKRMLPVKRILFVIIFLLPRVISACA